MLISGGRHVMFPSGEQVAMGIRHFACRLAAKRGDAAVLLAAQALRAVALGVVVTAQRPAVRGGGGRAPHPAKKIWCVC